MWPACHSLLPDAFQLLCKLTEYRALPTLMPQLSSSCLLLPRTGLQGSSSDPYDRWRRRRSAALHHPLCCVHCMLDTEMSAWVTAVLVPRDDTGILSSHVRSLNMLLAGGWCDSATTSSSCSWAAAALAPPPPSLVRPAVREYLCSYRHSILWRYVVWPSPEQATASVHLLSP